MAMAMIGGRAGLMEELQARLDATAGTQAHVQALDGVVSVNTYFTAAVFIGIAFIRSDSVGDSLVTQCRAGPDIARKLLVLEVVSFGCYLFSSLVAQGMKLLIVVLHSHEQEQQQEEQQQQQQQQHAKKKMPVVAAQYPLLRLGMLATAVGTIAGTLFLLLSIVCLVEMRLGLLSCGSTWAKAAILPLLIMVSIGLLIFVSTVLYSFLG